MTLTYSVRAEAGGLGRTDAFSDAFGQPSPRHGTSGMTDPIDSLVVALRLPPRDRGGDWALDAADGDRVVEFCEFYDLADLCADQKTALMGVIVASLDDHLLATPPSERDPAISAMVEALLRRDFALHERTVESWCRHDAPEGEPPFDEDEPGDDLGAESGEDGWAFCVSPLMRRVWAECSAPVRGD